MSSKLTNESEETQAAQTIDKNDYIDEDEDVDALLNPKSQAKTKHEKRLASRFRHSKQQQHHHQTNNSTAARLTRRMLTIRSTLLAICLTTILFVFWLLDSLKDPVFAVLVNGNLKKHQPLAKMASVGGTLVMVLVMEVVSYERKKKRRRNRIQDSGGGGGGSLDKLEFDFDRDVTTGSNMASVPMDMNREMEMGGGRWTKMSIESGFNVDGDGYGAAGEEEDAANHANASSQIPVSIFQTVGVSYILAFASIAYFLSNHPNLRDPISHTPPSSSSSSSSLSTTDTHPNHYEFHDHTNNDGTYHNHTHNQNDSGDILWHILGYITYLTIESFGSISVATFWSFTNSTLTLKAAKAYYGLIIAMAQLGAIGGSTVATFHNVSLPFLFVVACVGILFQMLVMQFYGKNFPSAMTEADDRHLGSTRSSDGGAKKKDYEAELEQKALEARRAKQRQRQRERHPHRRQLNRTTSLDGYGPISSKVFMSGVYLILKYNYLLLILGVSCLYEVSLTCLDYEMKLIGLDRFSGPSSISVLENSNNDDDDMGMDMDSTFSSGDASSSSSSSSTTFAMFMGRYGQLTNLLSLLLSYYAFPYLMERYGLNITLRLFPTLLVFVTILTYLALPMNLPVLFVSMSLLKAMTYSINDPAKEILYIPTSNVVKFKAKFWIDVVGARVAKALGSSINTYAGTVERIVQYGSIPSVLTALALWVICYAAGLEFDGLLESGDIVGVEEDEEEEEEEILLNYDDDDDDFGGGGAGYYSLGDEDEDDCDGLHHAASDHHFEDDPFSDISEDETLYSNVSIVYRTDEEEEGTRQQPQ